MITIIRAGIEHCELIAKIARASFLESHGHSASKEDIASFMADNFSEIALSKDLSDPNTYYHIIYYKEEVAGYSKIELNVLTSNMEYKDLTKLDRIYLLKKFYGKNLGTSLFDHIVSFSEKRGQKGIWLYVWVENNRAIKFYTKHGFKIIGDYDFQISKTHANPNHIMHLSY